MSHVMAQPVEYLGLSDSVASRPSKEEPVIVITIRPDEGSFRPHNLAIAKVQAQRLWEDLGSVLTRSAVLLACVLLSALDTGCSARVEVESASRRSPLPASKVTQAATDERARTMVEVGILQNQSPQPAAPEAPHPPSAKAVASETKPVTISGNTIIVSYRAGDVTNHGETHIHVHEPPPPRVEERGFVQRDAGAEPTRHLDERCERLAREHEQRVEMWKRFPFGR